MNIADAFPPISKFWSHVFLIICYIFQVWGEASSLKQNIQAIQNSYSWYLPWFMGRGWMGWCNIHRSYPSWVGVLPRGGWRGRDMFEARGGGCWWYKRIIRPLAKYSCYHPYPRYDTVPVTMSHVWLPSNHIQLWMKMFFFPICMKEKLVRNPKPEIEVFIFSSFVGGFGLGVLGCRWRGRRCQIWNCNHQFK